MIKLDGSYGEGGGQILRTAIALSAITGVDIEIQNVRKARSKPGLAPQHLKAVEAVASICEGKLKGCSLHSTSLSFIPGKIKGGKFDIDIGTAGSISLLLQCLMPACIYASEAIELNIKGGTDVSWSPTIDYFRFVTLNALSRMGYKCNFNLMKRGYYPRGGGYIIAKIEPSILKRTNFDTNDCEIVEGISHSSNLPSHVAERQKSSAEKELLNKNYESNISIEIDNSPSIGSGLTLWCGTVGGSELGKPGFSAENVGKNAANEIIPELRSGAGVDVHLADQLIPYIGMVGGSFTTRNISQHTRTNIWVTEQFLNIKFNIDGPIKGLYRIWN